MSIKVDVSQVLIPNHPRWDPFMRLEQISDGRSASGQSFKESTPDAAHTLKEHEVVEFEPNRAIAMLTHYGPAEIRGHTTFEAVGHAQTVLIMTVKIRGMDESLSGMMTGANQNSLQNKQLIESEGPG